MLPEGQALCPGWAATTCLVLQVGMSLVSLEPTAVFCLHPSEWHIGIEHSVLISILDFLQHCSFCHHPSLLSSWLLEWGTFTIAMKDQDTPSVMSWSFLSLLPSPFHLSLIIPHSPSFLFPSCLLSLSILPSPPLL